MSRLGPTGLTQLLTDIKTWVTTKLGNYVTTDTTQTITGKKSFTNAAIQLDSLVSMSGSTMFINTSASVPRGAWPTDTHRVGRIYIGDGTSYNGAWFIVDPIIDTTKAVYRMVTTNPDNTDSTRFSIMWDGTETGARCRKNVSTGDLLPYANNTYNLGSDSNKWDIGYIHNLIGSNKEDKTEDVNSYYSTTSGSHMTFYTTSNGGTKLSNVPAAVNTHLESRTIRYLSSSDWIVEQICHNSFGLYYRQGTNGTWGAWKTFAFTDSSISGNAATATVAQQVRKDPAAGSTADLLYSQCAGTDIFRLQVGGASNAGYAEIATADDGSEPIYVRQYKGTFTSLQRTAALLDSLGNTSFPGQVTGVTFNGPLTWNGDTLSYTANHSLYFYSGQPAIANCFEGSSNDFTKFSYPTGGTSASSSNANIQTLRFDWGNTYWHDLFMSPNNNYLWHRNVVNSDARGWRRIVEENATGLTDQSWNINIAGTSTNVTGTVAIANGGTGATTRLSAVKALTNEAVGTPTHFLAITTNYAKAGYTTVAQAKTVLGITGDIVSHNASEFLTADGTADKATKDASGNVITSTYVNLTGDQSISGLKSYSKHINIAGDQLGNEQSVNGNTCLYLTSKRDTVNKSGIYVTKFRQNVAQGSMGASDVIYLSYDVLENEVRTNGTLKQSYGDWSNDVPGTLTLYSEIGTRNLGYAGYPWTSAYVTNLYIDGTQFVPSEVMYLAGNETVTGTKIFNGDKIVITQGNGYRMVCNSDGGSSGYGVFQRVDGSSWYLMVTAQDDALGTWTSARPASMNLSTGVLNINGKANEANKVQATIAAGATTALVQATVASNDCFRIAAGGAANAGWAEIATGDDANEPIYVRQYKGSFTTLQRTATLLDGSGNTSFPGTVTATGFSGPVSDIPSGTTYVSAVADGGAVVNSQAAGFGAIWRAPTKNYQVAAASWPSNGDNVYICYSVANTDVTEGNNTVSKSLIWNAGSGTLTTTTFSGALSGNASSATEFSANTTVALTGDATGTSAGSKKGWSVPVTLANSGVTAGDYGPSEDASPAHSGTFTVPSITVDAKGRITAASTKTITLPADNNTDTKATQTVTNGNACYPLLIANTASASHTGEEPTTETDGVRKAYNINIQARYGFIYARNSYNSDNLKGSVAGGNRTSAGFYGSTYDGATVGGVELGRVDKYGNRYSRLYATNHITDGALAPDGTAVATTFDVGVLADGTKYLNTSAGWYCNVYPTSDNTRTLGTASLKWSNVYATTFTGDLVGNATTATEFSANKDVTLTGDVTGTASSKAGWSVATTLANSGVTAGTYGPSADVTGNNNTTISVPQITVDAKGRITSVTNRTYTSVNTDTNTDTKVTQTVTTGNSAYPVLLSATANATTTGTTTSRFSAGLTVNTRYSSIYMTNKYDTANTKGVRNTSSSPTNGVLYFRSYDATQMGTIRCESSKNGYQQIYMMANNYIKDGAIDPEGTNTTCYITVRVRDNGSKTIYTDGSWENSLTPYANNTYSLGTSSLRWKAVYATNFYENGTALTSKYVQINSLAGGNVAGSLTHSIGSLVLARCSGEAFNNIKLYGNVAGLQLYPCRTEIYTITGSTGTQFVPIVVRSGNDSNLGSGTWRYLGGASADFNNTSGDVYGMFLRVA